MANPFDSPVDIAVETPEIALPGLQQMAVAVGVAILALLLVNAHALASWTGGLEPGANSARMDAAARGLAEQTAARGLDGPRAAIKQSWDRLKAADWPDHRKKS
jgi:hypothetical protein